MQIHTMPQRSDEWYAVRIGKITATDFTTVANGKDKSIEDLCVAKAFEIRRGLPRKRSYTNGAMEYGVEMEEEALGAYSREQFITPKTVGFVEYSKYFGFSPDALIGSDGGLEIKCPEPFTHDTYLYKYRKSTSDKWIDSGYRWQIQSSLYMSGRDWWDFVSYCPEITDEPMLIYRVMPDKDSFQKIEAGMRRCEKRIKELLEAYDG